MAAADIELGVWEGECGMGCWGGKMKGMLVGGVYGKGILGEGVEEGLVWGGRRGIELGEWEGECGEGCWVVKG